jgi:hypothetical protein
MLERNVEIDPHQRPFATPVHITNRLLGHISSFCKPVRIQRMRERRQTRSKRPGVAANPTVSVQRCRTAPIVSHHFVPDDCYLFTQVACSITFVGSHTLSRL